MDCNNFFVSCERLFRPDLLGKPVAVLSSNDGCVVARSQEVKDLGIPMGVPYFEVKDICKKNNVQIFSSNFALYRDISGRVMAALRDEFDTCEIYSVDEAFFKVPNTISVQNIDSIRKRIIQKTGIPVSFGIGTTKTIAKIASTYAKKGTGVCEFDEKAWKTVRGDIACGSIWGIGRQTTKKLSALEMSTVEDVCRKELSYLKQILGVIGERLYFELSGIAMYEVGEGGGEVHQSISSTRSFAESTHEKSVLLSALGHHAAHVCEKLRMTHCVASQLTIICAPSRFGDFGHRKSIASTTLEIPTSSTTVLLKEVIALLNTLYDSEIPYKKAGVTVSGIVPEKLGSQSLFGGRDAETKAVYEVADTLNNRFGKGTVRPGVVMRTEKWMEHAQKKSPEYTTQWTQIPHIKAR